MKLGIGLPSPEYGIHPDFAFHNLPQIISHAKNNISDIEILIRYDSNVRTDRNRNNILIDFLDNNVDAVLWLDVDMIYPVDIIKTYLDTASTITHTPFVIGCVYHKRSEPYDPIVYLKSKTPGKYKPVDVTQLEGLTKVDALGYGGMYVPRVTYDALGDDKWTHYGHNFHIPINVGDQNSHDIVFCEQVKSVGGDIYVHGGVKAGHFTTNLVTTDTWINHSKTKPETGVSEASPEEREYNIAVIMPSIDIDVAQITMDQLKMRSGLSDDIKVGYFVAEDYQRSGFVKTFDSALYSIDADYYVYVAEDAYAGKNWLSIAYETLKNNDKQFLAFNDGKWHGKLASFGMGTWAFFREYWHTDYKSHYIDTEITLLAMRDNEFIYNPDSVLIEIDYKKKSVNQEDKELFNQRKKVLFSDRPDLMEMYG